MFKYSKKAGYMGVATIILAILPVVLAIIIIPGLPETLPMRYNEAGEVIRWGSRYELLVAPTLAVAFGFGIYIQTARKCADHARESAAMARSTAERYMLSGVLTTGVINICNAYLLYTSLTGTNPLMF